MTFVLHNLPIIGAFLPISGDSCPATTQIC